MNAPMDNRPYNPDAPPDDEKALLDDDAATDVFTEEKKPANRAMLLVFAALVLGGAGFYYVYQKDGGPAQATAAASDAAKADKTINAFLTDKGQSLRMMEQMLRNTEMVVARFAAFPGANQVPLSELKKNPFRFAPVKTDDQQESEAQARARREAERQAALKGAQALKLQSIMYGETRKSCLIGGTFYREGDEVGGFTVEKIEPRSVIVRSGPYRFQLQTPR